MTEKTLPSVETSIASDTTTSFEQGAERASTNDDQGVSAQFDPNGDAQVKTGLGDDDLEAGDETAEPQEGDPKSDDKEGEPEAGDGLPDWDLDNEEVVAAYDAKFLNEDGSIDASDGGAFAQEFWASYRADPEKAGLSDKTYAYLKDRLGIPKEAVKQFEAGQVAIAKQAEQKFYNDVGGKARWETAVQWGRSTYSKEQQDRFNAAMSKGGQDAMDAVDALMARYDRVNPRSAGLRHGRPVRRPSTPGRDVTGSAAAAGSGKSADVFKSAAEYNSAIAEARKSGDPKAIDAVRAKGRRSNLK